MIINAYVISVWQKCKKKYHYCQVSNIRRTMVGNKIVDHSDVVGAFTHTKNKHFHCCIICIHITCKRPVSRGIYTAWNHWWEKWSDKHVIAPCRSRTLTINAVRNPPVWLQRARLSKIILGTLLFIELCVETLRLLNTFCMLTTSLPVFLVLQAYRYADPNNKVLKAQISKSWYCRLKG